MNPTVQFYLSALLISVVVAAVAVRWNRWYIRKLWRETYIEELRKELLRAWIEQLAGKQE